MASSTATRLLLTAIFAGLGGYCLVRCLLPARRLPHHGSALVTDALGVAMGAVMITMLWGLPLRDRWGVQPAVFGAAAGWYLVRAARAGTPPGARVALLHHGATMAAMLWMLAATRAGTTPMASMVAAGPQGLAAAGPVGPALAGYLALAAVWWARSALATPQGLVAAPAHLFGARGAAACQALMAAATCAALLAH